jgi:hypothetical protein
MAALEVTWSEEAGYHPHLHVLFEGRFADLDGFKAQWMRAVGGKHHPHIVRPKKHGDDGRRDMLHEVLKYVLKPSKTMPPEVEAAVLSVIDHRRTFRTFGGLLADELDNQEDEQPLACPCCGEEKTPETSHQWHVTTVLDEDLAKLERRHPGFVFRGWKLRE